MHMELRKTKSEKSKSLSTARDLLIQSNGAVLIISDPLQPLQNGDSYAHNQQEEYLFQM